MSSRYSPATAAHPAHPPNPTGCAPPRPTKAAERTDPATPELAPATAWRLLGRLADLLRQHHQVRLLGDPMRLVVVGACTVEIEVAVDQTTHGRKIRYRDRSTGKPYGAQGDVRIVGRKVRSAVAAPARAALVDAHETLLRHVPDTAGRCMVCRQPMPCHVVANNVATMRNHRHLEPSQTRDAELGAHSCGDWVHPYVF